MRLQASGCYYHPGRLAVAVCAKCGVGICRDCAVKNAQGTIICYKCGNEELRQEHKEYRKWLKERGGNFSKGTDFIVPGIIGILIVVGMAMLFYLSGQLNEIVRETGKDGISIIIYELFTIPFCYIVIDDLFAHKYDTTFNLINNWVGKIAISFILGGIVFPVILIHFIIRKNKSKKNKDLNIDETK